MQIKNECNCGNNCKFEEENTLNQSESENNSFLSNYWKNKEYMILLSEDDEYDMIFVNQRGDSWGVQIPKFDVSETEIKKIANNAMKYYNINDESVRLEKLLMIVDETPKKLIKYQKIENHYIPIELDPVEAIRIMLLEENYEDIIKYGLISEARASLEKDPVINYLASKSPILMLKLLGEPIYEVDKDD